MADMKLVVRTDETREQNRVTNFRAQAAEGLNTRIGNVGAL